MNVHAAHADSVRVRYMLSTSGSVGTRQSSDTGSFPGRQKLRYLPDTPGSLKSVRRGLGRPCSWSWGWLSSATSNDRGDERCHRHRRDTPLRGGSPDAAPPAAPLREERDRRAGRRELQPGDLPPPDAIRGRGPGQAGSRSAWSGLVTGRSGPYPLTRVTDSGSKGGGPKNWQPNFCAAASVLVVRRRPRRQVTVGGGQSPSRKKRS